MCVHMSHRIFDLQSVLNETYNILIVNDAYNQNFLINTIILKWILFNQLNEQSIFL